MVVDLTNISELHVPEDADQRLREMLSLVVEHLRTSDDESSVEFRALPKIHQLIVLNNLASMMTSIERVVAPYRVANNEQAKSAEDSYRGQLSRVKFEMKRLHRPKKTPTQKMRKDVGLRFKALQNNAAQRGAMINV